MPRLLAVVGGKHSGKTTVIEHLIIGFTGRGYRVGTIKEMIRVPTIDTPQKETDRYRKAGAESVVAVPRTETVLFISKRLSVKEILPHLRDLDYVLLEGFESEAWLPKIVAAKTAEEATGFFDGSVVAVSGLIADSDVEKTKIQPYPVLSSIRETKKLADIAEAKALSCPV
jgi:molybdopterin-guanine dinucleotide biosynthesis adapter protein